MIPHREVHIFCRLSPMKVSSDRILYEDQHLLAVNKRSSELVVKGKGRTDTLPLLDFLKKEYPGLRALHRLDFETSGVTVFARTKAAHDAVLKAGFDGWEKTYVCLVMGRMNKDSGAMRMPLAARGRGKVEAETLYTVLERFRNSTFVEACITTGRHHQIRQHFAMIEHPLVLDAEYGHKKYNGTFIQEFRYRKFFLHASKLRFPHPITNVPITVKAPLPRNFEAILATLRTLR